MDFVISHTVEDLERNNGKDRPYFMEPELQKVMDIQNTSEGDDEETPLVK